MICLNRNYSAEECLLRIKNMDDSLRGVLNKKYLKIDLSIAAIALICLAGGLASIVLGISHNTSLSLGLVHCKD
jgi:hypothetical protein